MISAFNTLTLNPQLAAQPGGNYEFNRPAADVLKLLYKQFGIDFCVMNATTGHWVNVPNSQPLLTSDRSLEVCKAVARSQSPEIVAEHRPLAVLAVPLPACGLETFVAVSTFRTDRDTAPEGLAVAARALGLNHPDITEWAPTQSVWNIEAVFNLAELIVSKCRAESENVVLRREIDDLSQQLSGTYEEICLLFRLTQNLKISSTQEELVRLTLSWLAETMPAKLLAVQLIQPEADVTGQPSAESSRRPLITHGDMRLAPETIGALIEKLGPSARRNPVVVNPPITAQSDWGFPEVKQFVLVPLAEGDNLFGWLAIVNHRLGQEFGTTQASLLGSVAAILGIHAGNLELYRQQAEFLSGVVRALTSAIDAKDPYTCGHSDRVARVSARLAAELGCTEEEQKMIFLSGLLHDVGKIGIDDSVLRKPGSLTDEEFSHIKMHAEIGYRILKDLKQLGSVLPVVRHHHESWDGRGYPHGLAGEEIPFMARIVSVADSFDAMSSDRPYRSGMPDEKLDSILRSGAGKQWDADVIEAFFRAREDIRKIALRERKNLQLDNLN